MACLIESEFLSGTSRNWSLGSHDGRQSNMKFGAYAGRAFGSDRAAVHACNPARDSKAETGSRSLPRTHFVGAMEAFKDRFEFGGLDPDACVLHGDQRLFFRSSEGDFAAPA